MQFFTGLVLGAALLALVLWLRSRKIAVKWYEWLIGALGLLLLWWAVHDFFSSMAEFNEFAAWTFLWLLGAPGFILVAIAAFLPWRRHCRRINLQ